MSLFGSDLSEMQERIVSTYDRNPDMTPKQIASTCDCSASYVRETLGEYRPRYNNDGLGF